MTVRLGDVIPQVPTDVEGLVRPYTQIATILSKKFILFEKLTSSSNAGLDVSNETFDHIVNDPPKIGINFGQIGTLLRKKIHMGNPWAGWTFYLDLVANTNGINGSFSSYLDNSFFSLPGDGTVHNTFVPVTAGMHTIEVDFNPPSMPPTPLGPWTVQAHLTLFGFFGSNPAGRLFGTVGFTNTSYFWPATISQSATVIIPAGP
jgi:hypothetical protein